MKQRSNASGSGTAAVSTFTAMFAVPAYDINVQFNAAPVVGPNP